MRLSFFFLSDNMKKNKVGLQDKLIMPERRMEPSQSVTWCDDSVEATEAVSALWLALSIVSKWNSYKNWQI